MDIDTFGNIKISKNTHGELKKLIDLNIEVSLQLVDKIESTICKIRSEIENNKKSYENLQNALDLKKLLRLNEFSLLLNLIALDLFCSFKIYINSVSKIEGIFSAKILILTVNEASKKIFHFGKYRKKSIWGKDVEELVNELFPNALPEYSRINRMIDNLDEIFKEFNWEDKRNLIVHYDDNPSKVYSMLLKLDIEEVSKRVIPFLKVKIEMIKFSQILLDDYNILLKFK